MLRHFLSRIVRNQSFTRYSYLTAAKRSAETDILLSEIEDCLPDGRQNPAQRMEQREITRNINAFLGSLPQEEQGIFVARYFYAVPLEQIAETYGNSVRQIQYRLQKMRTSLRKRLEQEGIAV